MYGIILLPENQFLVYILGIYDTNELNRKLKIILSNMNSGKGTLVMKCGL